MCIDERGEDRNFGLQDQTIQANRIHIHGFMIQVQNPDQNYRFSAAHTKFSPFLHIFTHSPILEGTSNESQKNNFEFHAKIELNILPSTLFHFGVCKIEEDGINLKQEKLTKSRPNLTKSNRGATQNHNPNESWIVMRR